MAYREDEFLMLSGLQHLSFCRRQWALIHLEDQWAENWRTTDGALMHDNAHDKGFQESRGDMLITRGMAVHSAVLGVSGECDVLEFHRVSSGGIPLDRREGLWQPFPVEYKRGKADGHPHADELQLCGQAMCLEEMLCCDIPEGALFYGETKRRQRIDFTTELRSEVSTLLAEMHQLARRGTTPKVKPGKWCNACSLKELCLPKLMRVKSASTYIRQHMEESE